MILEDFARGLGYEERFDEGGRSQWYNGDMRLRNGEEGGTLSTLQPWYDRFMATVDPSGRPVYGTRPFAEGQSEVFRGPDGRAYLRIDNHELTDQHRSVGGKSSDLIYDPQNGYGIEIGLQQRWAQRFQQDDTLEKIANNMPIILGIIFGGAAAAGALGGAGGVAAGAGEGAAAAGGAGATAGSTGAVAGGGAAAGSGASAGLLPSLGFAEAGTTLGGYGAAGGGAFGGLGGTAGLIEAGAAAAGAGGAVAGAGGGATANGFLAQQLVNAGVPVETANSIALAQQAGSTASTVSSLADGGVNSGGLDGALGDSAANYTAGLGENNPLTTSGGNWYDSLLSTGGNYLKSLLGNALTGATGTGGSGGSWLNNVAAIAPSLAAINYARNQDPFDTSRLTQVYDQFKPESRAFQYDVNTGLGRDSLTSSLSRRGVSGSSFGDQSLTNFNTFRDLGRRSLIDQGLSSQAGVAGQILSADVESRKSKNDLYGRALLALAGGLSPRTG